jgi:pyruvate dehydrogenase E2 component (dihydrolipoamide acetyltransferase)
MATKQPENKSHFILPDLGEGVHEAELIRWCVKPGQQVNELQTMAEMETDKALVEVPSPWSGVIKELKGEAGDIIEVGSILVTYDTSAAPSATAGGTTANDVAAEAGDDEDAGTVVGAMGALAVSETFTRRRTGNDSPSVSRKALATPAIRRLARASGLDIDRIPGTGRGGRVTASDVHAFAGGGATTSAATGSRGATVRALPATDAAPVYISDRDVAERIPFRGVRRKIAAALDRSVKTAVHFTVVDEADVTTLDRKRKEYAQVLGRKLSLLPFAMAAAIKALRQFPQLNANVDDAKHEILVKSAVHLGCAVDTEHGLMVPVMENAQTLSIVQIADAVAELAAACRNRTIEREKLVGGTFTISNVGSHGGMFATPIINYPEVGILGVGRAKERVLTRDGMFYAGHVLPLSLSCDHRVVDGALGARYLNAVVRILEDPAALLGD